MTIYATADGRTKASISVSHFVHILTGVLKTLDALVRLYTQRVTRRVGKVKGLYEGEASYSACTSAWLLGLPYGYEIAISGTSFPGVD